eukprot:scaffold392_cov234-Pinguiococcus_pyrenoidosus.AAC.6
MEGGARCRFSRGKRASCCAPLRTIEAPEGQRGDGARHVIQMQIEHRSLTVRGTRRGRDVRRARPTAPSRRRRARAGHPFHVVPLLLLFIKAAAIREKFAEVRPPWPAGRLAMVRLQHFRALVDRRELQIVRGQLDPHLGRRLRLERLPVAHVLGPPRAKPRAMRHPART